MKKKLSLIALLLVLVSVFTLAGCGGGEDNDPTVGNYKLAAAEMMGITVGAEDIGEFDLNLQAGGKGNATVDGTDGKLEWKRDGDDVSITMEGEEVNATIEDDAILTFDNFMDSGMTFYFVKDGADVDMSRFTPTP